MNRSSPPPPDPRAAYIHVPFCAHRCGYCDFTVIAGRDDLAEDYLQALEIELRGLGAPRPVTTLYLGGGTPTQLPRPHLERLLQLVTSWLPVRESTDFAGIPSELLEFTVEANPEHLDVDTVDLLRAAGVHRVSLGTQSWNNDKLMRLDRFHTAAENDASLSMVRAHGLRVGVDLIFAAPEETLEEWDADVSTVIERRPGHVSTYGLTWEQGTRFWTARAEGRLRELDEDTQREMYLHGIDRLAAAGYEHYEVSNFALPGERSRHNQVYWRGLPYFGFGPGAARYVEGRRERNHRGVLVYLRRVLSGESATVEVETLDARTRAQERLVFSLRLLEGIDLTEFSAATGYELDELTGATARELADHGLLEFIGNRVRLSRQGLLVSDAVFNRLLR